MYSRPIRFLHSPIAWQIGVAIVGLVGLAFVPPQQGQMLLVPVTAAAAAQTPRTATANDTRIVGRGPFPGSLVVDARRASLLAATWGSAILIVVALGVGCTDRGVG